MPTDGSRWFTLGKLTSDRENSLQSEWPGGVRIAAGPPDSIFLYFPFMFERCFPGIEQQKLADFALVCKLLSNLVFMVDSLQASETSSEDPVTTMLRGLASQFELTHILNRIFGQDDGVWLHLRAAISRFCWAIQEEQAYRSGKRALSDLSEDEGIAVALGRASFAQFAIIGLGSLSGIDGSSSAAILSVDKLSLAQRLMKDLQGWKNDLRSRRPSILLSRLARDPKVGLTAEGGDVRKITAHLYYGGYAISYLNWTLELCREAIEAAGDLGGHPKCTTCGHLKMYQGTVAT